MRNNQPVTDIETLLPEGQFIYSRTCTRGMIVEANEAFASISGYTQEEMIGQPHNMVRHPDMPSEAFADMWKDLKAGRPWRGLVKNRRKDGGFYWVEANASPVREDGRVVGYQSVRSRPTREQVSAASEAYRRIREGDRSIYIEHGRVVKRTHIAINAFSSLTNQMLVSGLTGLVLSSALAVSVLLPGTIDSTVALTLGGLGAIVSLVFLLICTPSAARDLNRISVWLENILCSGDLKSRLDIQRKDVIGAIGRKADKLVSSIRATLQGIEDVASQVGRSAVDVEDGMAQVRESADTQNRATSAAAAAIEETSASVSCVADSIRQTRSNSEQTGILVSDGATVTREASRSIQALAEVISSAAGKVEQLGERSAEISRIAGVIRDIADQTNLLALNAAIEAARAGEQGRGFAVVADEVRKLAERTGNATGEINTMIQRIQSDTQGAVNNMRQGAEQVTSSVELANKTEASLSQINDGLHSSIQQVLEIEQASVEQRAALHELASNVESIAQMADRSVSTVALTSASVKSLKAMESRMRKAVRQYST